MNWTVLKWYIISILASLVFSKITIANESSLFSLGTGGKISYKEYLYRRYGIKSQKKELCVALDKSLNTPAIVLKMANIVIYGETGPMKAQQVDDFKYFQTGGFLKDVRKLRNWGIVYEYPRYKKAFESFYSAYEQYIKKRHFDRYNGPNTPPSPRLIMEYDLYNCNLNNTYNINNITNKNDELSVLVLILPDGMRGSVIKIYIKHVEKFNACLGTFEDIMIKYGNIPYMIDPVLPYNNINTDLCWVWVLVYQFQENHLKVLHFLSHLNPCRKEIIAFTNMITLAYRGLEQCYNATINECRQYLPLEMVLVMDKLKNYLQKKLLLYKEQLPCIIRCI